ncbi:MAG: YtxH domain-containing protein [Nitrospirales bacterium]
MRGNEMSAMGVFLVGGLIGAGVALLIAPQTGPKLRRTLRDYAERGTESVRERGRDAWDTAVDQGKEYVESGKTTVRQAGEAARDIIDTGKEAVQKARDR